MRASFAYLMALVIAGLFVESSAQSGPAPGDTIQIETHPQSAAITTIRKSLTECVPSSRGFIAPILQDADKSWSPNLPEDLSSELALAADIVARRLARDGLLATLAQAVQVIGPGRLASNANTIVETVRSLGLPVDLLRFFPAEGTEETSAFNVIVDVMRMFGGDTTADQIIPELNARPFHFIKSRPDFAVATESGEYDIDTVRLQLSRGDYYQGIGDGGNVDVARQLIELLPDAKFLISIEDKNLNTFLTTSKTWAMKSLGRITILPEPLPVSQWAQDNGKPGFVGDNLTTEATENTEKKTSGAEKQIAALLVPRYASRREEDSAFIPGETFLLDAVAATGPPIIHSPLLFQGGDLIAVRDPASRQTILLVGEAEIYRNTALGLTRDQVVDAFRQEFGVDRCVVLSAISYHIDYEVSIRAVGNTLVAFVNDSQAANREVLKAGLGALENARLIDASAAKHAHQAIAAGHPEESLEPIENVLINHSVGYGRFPESFAAHFVAGASDSGIGNLQRFLVAIDTIALAGPKPMWRPADPHGEAYVRTLQRRDAERNELRATLGALGWRVVGVPSTSEADRSLNYLNGVHMAGRYLMPAYGGLFAGVDRSAEDVFRREMGPKIEVTPVLSGESQRRVGAVRCSMCIFPHPN